MTLQYSVPLQSMLRGVVLVEGIDEVLGMFFPDILNTKVINNE